MTWPWSQGPAAKLACPAQKKYMITQTNSHWEVHPSPKVDGNHQIERHELFLHKSACLLLFLLTRQCTWNLSSLSTPGRPELKPAAQVGWDDLLRSTASITNFWIRFQSHVVNLLSNICSWLLSLPLSHKSLPTAVVQLYGLSRRCQFFSFPWPPPHHKSSDHFQYREQMLVQNEGKAAQGGQRFFCSSSDSNFGHRLVFQGGHDKHTYPHKSLSCPPYPPSNHIHSPTFKEAELISCFFTKQPKILRPLSLGWPYVTAR